MGIIDNNFLRVCGLTLALGLVVLMPCAQADVLKGKVQQSDSGLPTRIRRPALPVLTAVGAAASSVMKGAASQAAAELEAGDFSLHFQKAAPLVDDTAYGAAPVRKGNVSKLNADVESNELIIAWEAWHKRVCAAIFDRWRVLGTIPGVARTSLRFTRDRHVEVIVKDVMIDPDVFRITPRYSHMSMDELREAFAETVRNSVAPLNGDFALSFPEGSRRQVVRFDPAFRGTTENAGYDWKRNDYERVSGN